MQVGGASSTPRCVIASCSTVPPCQSSSPLYHLLTRHVLLNEERYHGESRCLESDTGSNFLSVNASRSQRKSSSRSLRVATVRKCQGLEVVRVVGSCSVSTVRRRVVVIAVWSSSSCLRYWMVGSDASCRGGVVVDTAVVAVVVGWVGQRPDWGSKCQTCALRGGRHVGRGRARVVSGVEAIGAIEVVVVIVNSSHHWQSPLSQATSLRHSWLPVL